MHRAPRPPNNVSLEHRLGVLMEKTKKLEEESKKLKRENDILTAENKEFREILQWFVDGNRPMGNIWG